MKKNIAMKWVEALRSGKYKRGTGQLRDEKNQFCCLGVLCNLHAQEHPKVAAAQKDRCDYMYHSSYLPGAVQRWAGMKSEDGTVPFELAPRVKGNRCENLAAMNDWDMPFSKIATFIEKNWKAL